MEVPLYWGRAAYTHVSVDKMRGGCGLDVSGVTD